MAPRNFLEHSVVEYLRTALAEVDAGAPESGAAVDGQSPCEPNGLTLMLIGTALVESTPEGLTAVMQYARHRSVTREQLEEAALQSYLFLGFPRMITALEILAQAWPVARDIPEPAALLDEIGRSVALAPALWQSGIDNCRRIYGNRFDDLAAYMYNVSPTLLTWMIQEGYGKVLSRPGLSIPTRELLNVTLLLLEERERQLFSHIRGALNAGVAASDLQKFLLLHEPFSRSGTGMATRILERLAPA